MLAVRSRVSRLLPPWLRERLYGLWWGEMKWPMPLWRIRRRAHVDLGGQRLSFVDVRSTPYREWLQCIRLGIDEPLVTEALRAALRPGDVFLDVGSYMGGYALMASRLVGSDGRVFAFEPDPAAAAVLRANLAANSAHNVTVIEAAVAGHVGSGKLLGDGVSTSHLASGDGATPVTTLDAFCAEHNIVPNVVKLDIEGGERAALARAACAATVDAARLVVVEVHEFAGAEYNALVAALPGKTATRLDVRNAENYNVAFS